MFLDPCIHFLMISSVLLIVISFGVLDAKNNKRSARIATRMDAIVAFVRAVEKSEK